MRKFIYKEVPYEPQQDFVLFLNKYGEMGYRFHSMAQKVLPQHDFKTGQPKVQLVIVLEKETFNPDDMN